MRREVQVQHQGSPSIRFQQKIVLQVTLDFNAYGASGILEEREAVSLVQDIEATSGRS